MPELDFAELLEQDGVYLDPYKVTALTRVLKNANSKAQTNSLVVCTSPCLVFGFTASSSNAAAQFIQLHDTNVVPSNGAVPAVAFTVAATQVSANAWVPYPRAFKQGCVITNSTTQNTLTIGAADTLFDVQFV